MTLFVAGRLMAQPLKVKFDGSLDDVRSALTEDRYSGLPSQGWGSIFDPVDDYLNVGGPLRPKVGEPVLLDADESRSRPQRVLGRLYYDEYDKRSAKFLDNADLTPERTHIFRACDVSISDLPEQPGHYLVFAGSPRKALPFGHVVTALRSALIAVDQNVKIYQDDSPTAFEGHNFFKWLLYRTINDPDVGGVIHLEIIRHLTSEDGLARGTAIAGGAHFDRPELLALVAGQNTDFGPAKVQLRHDTLDLNVDVEIRPSGAFAIKVGDSAYGNDDELSKSEKCLKLIEDVAFCILPDLTYEWSNDTDWFTTHDAQFTEDARGDLMHALLSLSSGPPCPDCGRPT